MSITRIDFRESFFSSWESWTLNVDPASTMQVVNELIKARKKFDLLFIPGAGHTNGGPYGDRLRYDFFVHHLLGVEPPDWNKVEESNTEQR